MKVTADFLNVKKKLDAVAPMITDTPPRSFTPLSKIIKKKKNKFFV